MSCLCLIIPPHFPSKSNMMKARRSVIRVSRDPVAVISNPAVRRACWVAASALLAIVCSRFDESSESSTEEKLGKFLSDEIMEGPQEKRRGQNLEQCSGSSCHNKLLFHA